MAKKAPKTKAPKKAPKKAAPKAKKLDFKFRKVPIGYEWSATINGKLVSRRYRCSHSRANAAEMLEATRAEAESLT